uniref:Potential DNA-binding domain-containing protein n=1 Tax=Romanomermis culicivorax TaxID=13658 RepID=A0A915JVJ9_ROMCU
DNLLNDNELILLTPPTTSTQSAGPASLFFEHNDLLHRPPPPSFEIGYQQHQTTFNRRPSEATPPSGSLELGATIPTNICNNETLSSPVAAASSFNQQQQNNEYTLNNNQPYETKNQEIRNVNEIQFDGVCRPDLDLVDALSFPPSTSTAYVVHSSEIMPSGETAPESFQIVHQQQLQSELIVGQAPTSTGQKFSVTTVPTAPITTNLKAPKQPSAMCGYVTLEKDGQTQTPCRQRCINGFKFCIRHILNDSSAPYKPCAHVRVTGTKSIPCNNAVLQQANVNSKYCGTHLIMMGLRTPKTRKTKNASSVEQSAKDSVGCASSTTTTTDPVVKSTKKSTNKSTKSQKSTQESKNLNENYANFAAPPSGFPPNNNINNNCDSTANEYFTVDNQQQQQSQYLMQQNLYINHQGSSGSTPSSSNYHNQEFSVTSRPDSQVSVSSSSMHYTNNNNNNGYCSPQSPWRSNVQNQHVQPPPPPNVSLADIAKNNPELLSKLTFNPGNKELMDESNTITLYTIPENSIIYSPNQNLKSPQKNFVLADHNFLLRSDDPFLCPPNSSSSDPNTPQKFVALQQRSFNNFQQQQSIMTNNILSPVPSDLSVESSASQSSGNVRHNFPNKNIYQQTTNSPFLQQTFQNQTISTENQECSFVISNGQNPLSGQSLISSNLPPILRSHSTRPSAEIMLASPVPSPSVSIPRPFSSSLLPSNTNNNNSNGILNTNPYPSNANQPRQQIIRQIEQQDGKICYLISDISVPGLDPHTTIPSPNKKLVDQPKVATVLTNQTPMAAPSNTINNQDTIPGVVQRAPNVATAAAPSTKPKKVIRLKPKKRKLKMTGKYREIGFVNQMCRIVEDFDFDNTDLFPLGLEPSSSDSDSDDDMSHTGNMSLPKFDYDNFIVPPIADSVDNNNSVSSAFLSKAKRQLYLLKKNLNLMCKDLRRSHVESKIVGSTARLFPNSCGQAFYDLKCSNYNRSNSKRLAQIKRFQAIKRPSRHLDLGVVPRKCAYKFGAGDSKENKCQEKCLPYSIMCPKHILSHNEQTLFRNCTYRGSDDCPEPPCPMTALPVGLTEDGSFRCYKHQSKDLHKNSTNPEAVSTNLVNNQIKDKKRSKKTTGKKTTRKRKKKQTVSIGPYSDHGMAVIRPLYTPDEEAGESADEHTNEEYSNQDAQAALASVAKDFGFANYDLTDMLVRMPDESLIDNILDQDFCKYT